MQQKTKRMKAANCRIAWGLVARGQVTEGSSVVIQTALAICQDLNGSEVSTDEKDGQEQTSTSQDRSRDTSDDTIHLIRHSEPLKRPSHPTTKREVFNS
jgi:hypothetical protein